MDWKQKYREEVNKVIKKVIDKLLTEEEKKLNPFDLDYKNRRSGNGREKVSV